MKAKYSKILLKLQIVQIVSNEERRKKGLETLGQGYFKAYRLNPYNPLSYLIVIAAIPIGIVAFGLVGLYSFAYNPFLWD